MHENYANLHTDQERDYFMQRYHDVISSFGGKTSYDADNRPLLVMRSNLWASCYDVDGTDQTSLGQFSGRVQQTYKHSVPRFFVPEHGTFFFQAEDGTRDTSVTGVQTCPLPIWLKTQSMVRSSDESKATASGYALGSSVGMANSRPRVSNHYPTDLPSELRMMASGVLNRN